MPLWTCEQCGAQFPQAAAPPALLPDLRGRAAICELEGPAMAHARSVGGTPQDRLASVVAFEGSALDPGFAIGQRALLVPGADDCVMWDCIPLATPEAIEHVRSLGGLKAIAVSHPHYYGAVADWSEAFGGVPIYLHGDDRRWVTRPHPAIVPSTATAIGSPMISSWSARADTFPAAPSFIGARARKAGVRCSPAISRWWRWTAAR